jgi:hypothetical protein
VHQIGELYALSSGSQEPDPDPDRAQRPAAVQPARLRRSLDRRHHGRGGPHLRGGFYRYFESKSDLYAEAMDCFFTNPECGNKWEGVQVDPGKGELGAQIVRAYLSRQHHEDVENSCPMVALVGDAARTGPEVRRAYRQALEAMIAHLQLDPGGEGPPDRQTALAITALCIGCASPAPPTGSARRCWPRPRRWRSNSAAGGTSIAPAAPCAKHEPYRSS